MSARAIRSDERAGWEPPTLEDAALHGLAARWASFVAPSTEASLAGTLLTTLVAFGAAAGHSTYVQVGPTRHHTNEFLLVVGPTASGRKGEALAVGTRPLRLADEGWAGRSLGGFGSGESLVAELRDPVLGVDDDGNPKTIEPGADDKRLLVYEEEFASVLAVAGRDGSLLSSLLRRAWDSTLPLENRTKGRKIVASDHHVSAISAITPDELLRRVDALDVANGFLNRFLFAAVRRSKFLPEPPPLDRRLEDEYVNAFAKALTFARKDGAGPIRRTPEASEWWKQAYEYELAVDRPGVWGAACSRAEAHTTRLQILFALLDLSTEIRLEHVEAALAVWRYSEASAKLVFGDRVGDDIADKILAAVRAAPDGLTRGQIRDLVGGRLPEERIELALDPLHRYGLAVMDIDTDTGGRPAERWRAVREDAP